MSTLAPPTVGARSLPRWQPLLGLLAALVAACSVAPAAPAPVTKRADPRAAPVKAITIGMTSTVQAMSIAGGSTTGGGWQTLNELHASALVTSDVNTRQPVGRLAQELPSFEAGTMVVQPDGRMQVTYELRPGVTWHDGTPFTASDLVFSFLLNTDGGLPVIDRKLLRWLDDAAAPDDHTFVLTFREPYHQADALGPRLFWVHPRHLLQEGYERYRATGDANDVLNLAYFTSQYVHLGPFRLTAFDPGDGIELQAYDGYFLGRPKVDVVRVRFFGTDTALFSNLLAGTVDVSLGVLQPELGVQLMERWATTGEGTVRMYSESTRFLQPQWRPEVQREPANLDPRVRAGLYLALDRVSLADALLVGHPELVAYSVLPPIERGYEGTRDGLRAYGFDPDRARATLAEAGWAAGADGALRQAASGRAFATSLTSTPGEEAAVAAVAAYWRRLGIAVEEQILSPAQTRNNEARAAFPGYESTASFGDSILNFMQGPPATAQNRWSGNRAGYDDPRAQQLLRAYYASLTAGERLQSARALSDFVAADLTLMPLYYAASFGVARRGVTALDGAEGGAGAGAPYGTYTRNAHLWDMLP